MKLLSSLWPKVTVAMYLAVATVAVGAFAILFFVEYAWGNKDGDLLGHFIRAGLPPFFFASGVLHLLEGLTKMREAHLKWYKQGNVLRGLELVSLSLLSLLFFGRGYYIPANSLIFVLEGVCIVLILAILCWSFIVPRPNV